jgi:hypothetical protein
MRYTRLVRRFTALALRNPRLVVPLLSAAWRFRARGWHRRAPFLPLPPRDYVAWRLHTAYGDEEALPPAADLARYLRWSDRLNEQDRGVTRGQGMQ